VDAFRVVPFSPAALSEIVTEKSFGASPSVGRKKNVEYLGSYLSKVETKTIVVEHTYIDKDYLEDFAAYYVRCFADYPKTCTRLHFFSEEFSESEFRSALEHAADHPVENANYLGFIVLKPLPDTVIGRTCLRPWKDTADRKRVFPIVCDVPVNLFGINLSVRSLPFQEQDTDVAACATSALWSALHGTGRLFQHQIPSPVEITKAASAHSRVDDRSFPNRNGLNAFQIADAIRSVGLEPLAIRGSDTTMVRLAAAAYLRAGIPCILLSRLHDAASNVEIGRHAVAVNGYSLGNLKPKSWTKNATVFRAATIDRLYCHDDQIGPYAALEFDANGSISAGFDKASKVEILPENLIVPLYHKIRIPVSTIIEKVAALDDTIETLRAARLLPLERRLIWDVYLNDIARLRTRLFQSEELPTALRISKLEKSYPRYVWVAIARIGEEMQFMLLFDATDLLQAEQFIDCIPFDAGLCSALAVVSGNPEIRSINRVFAWFEAHSNELVATPAASADGDK